MSELAHDIDEAHVYAVVGAESTRSTASARTAASAFAAALSNSGVSTGKALGGRTLVDVPPLSGRLRLPASSLIPLWEQIRLPLLSPTELLVVESDNLMPQSMIMTCYRTLRMAAWVQPVAHIDSGDDRIYPAPSMHIWRRMPIEVETLRSQTEGRHPLRVPNVETMLRTYQATQHRSAVRFTEIHFWHGPLAFSLLPKIVSSGQGAKLNFTLTHKPSTTADPQRRPTFEVGLLLPHAKGTCGVFDLLGPHANDHVMIASGYNGGQAAVQAQLAIHAANANAAPQPPAQPPNLGPLPPPLAADPDPAGIPVGPIAMQAPPMPNPPPIPMPENLPPPPHHHPHQGGGPHMGAYQQAQSTGPYKITLKGGKIADLLRRGHMLPNGDLPLTVMIQEPFRDREKPMRRGRAKHIAGRPTSIQLWEFEKEQPPLLHWDANHVGEAGAQ